MKIITPCKKKFNKDDWKDNYQLFYSYRKDSDVFLWHEDIFIIRNSRAHKGSWRVKSNRQSVVFNDRNKRIELSYEEINDRINYAYLWMWAYMNGMSKVYLDYYKSESREIYEKKSRDD